MVKGIDYVGVAVVCFCHDGKGNFVMDKRSSNARDEHGRWAILGGGLKFGESVESALRREVKEEYCTDVLSFEFLGFRDVHREHQGKRTHWIALDFKVLVDSAKVRNGEPDSLDEVAWFTFDTMPQDVHSELPNFLRLYKEKLLGE